MEQNQEDEEVIMAPFRHFACTAAAGLLGMLSANGAWAQSCREPDIDPLRSPITQSRIPFNLTVERVRSESGNIVITLYGNDPNRWLKPEGSLHIYTVRARTPTTAICIILPGLRQYAIAVYHDANGNSQIDRNFLGVPTEDAGLSNNPSILKMVWPELRPSLFTVNSRDLAKTIRLRNPPG